MRLFIIIIYYTSGKFVYCKVIEPYRLKSYKKSKVSRTRFTKKCFNDISEILSRFIPLERRRRAN